MTVQTVMLLQRDDGSEQCVNVSANLFNAGIVGSENETRDEGIELYDLRVTDALTGQVLELSDREERQCEEELFKQPRF